MKQISFPAIKYSYVNSSGYKILGVNIGQPQ